MLPPETRQIKVRHIVSGTQPFACSACLFYSNDIAEAVQHDGMVSVEEIVIGEDGFVKERKILSESKAD